MSQGYKNVARKRKVFGSSAQPIKRILFINIKGAYYLLDSFLTLEQGGNTGSLVHRRIGHKKNEKWLQSDAIEGNRINTAQKGSLYHTV